jgi:hypothetical protein
MNIRLRHILAAALCIEAMAAMAGEQFVKTNRVPEFTNTISRYNATATNSVRFCIDWKNMRGDALTNSINDLVKSGQFCAVRGHSWVNDTNGGTHFYATNPVQVMHDEKCSNCEEKREAGGIGTREVK